MDTKQVIVVRREYPDGRGGVRRLRTGKMIAQACHASMAFLTRRINFAQYDQAFDASGDYFLGEKELVQQGDPFWSKWASFGISEEEREWLESSFRKICVYVNSEEELLDVYAKAKSAGLEAHLVTDSGFTEFDGVPTNTCVAIGPHESSRIDLVTGHLPLL